MLTPNFLLALAAALIPLFVGFIWYHPKVFGTAWLKITALSGDKMSGASMVKIFTLTYVLGYMITLVMANFTIHQFGFQSMLVGRGGMSEEAKTLFNEVMAQYGGNYRTFGHGALHGTIAGLFFATPVLAINGMFERRGFKYVAINGGYWILTLALVGGVMCAYN